MRVNEEQKEEIRKKIIQSSRTLFHDLGYEKTSVKKIAKMAGIAEGTIYNYFASKTEIFLEIMTTEYFTSDELEGMIITNTVDELYVFAVRYIKKFISLPKGVLKEIMIASMHLSRKNPKLLEKLAQLDLNFMRDFEVKLESLKALKLIKADSNCKELSEIFFGCILFEIVMYLYEQNRSKEFMFDQIKVKLFTLLSGYIKEEK